MISALAALCVILLAPLALVDVPPLLDYPNHLARAVVLAFGASDPILSQIYAAHWAIIPDLGTDLVLPPLLHVLPIFLAGRIVIGCTILLPVFGTIAYSRVIFGRRAAWPLASGLVAYNGTLLLGLLNFVAAIGIALLLAAGWMAWRQSYPWRTVTLTCIGTVALFFCHLMGVLLFYVLIASYELEWLWSHRAQPPVLLARAATLLPLLAVPFGLYLMSPLALVPDHIEYLSIAGKIAQLAFPFTNYILPLDIVTSCVVGGFLLVSIVTRHCRITLHSTVALLLVSGLYLASPGAFKGTYFVDTRFIIMLGFLLFGALLPTDLPRGVGLAAVTVFIVLFGVRMVTVAYAWHQHRHDVAGMQSVIASVEPGARVFLTSVPPEQAPGYWRNGPLARRLSNGIRVDYHLAALLLIERRAFWPFLFDNPSQQPVETLQPYRALEERARSRAGHGSLAVPGKVDLCGFDYVLLLEAGGEPDLSHFAADRLLLLAQSDMAALFRIRRSACH